MDGWGGIGRIFYSTLSQYARDHDLTSGEFEFFLVLIRAMDDEYLTWIAEQRAIAAANKETQT